MFNKSSSTSNSPTSPQPSAPAEIPLQSRNKMPQKSSGSAPSILGRDIVVNGEIKSDGDVQIDGRHEGNIVVNKLTVGEQGVINGTVKAKLVHVRGKIMGKIQANVVELAETANVTADITQDRLTIANGAFFDGNCSRLTKPAGSHTTLDPKSPATDTSKKKT